MKMGAQGHDRVYPHRGYDWVCLAQALYSLRSQVQTGDEIGSSEQFNRPQVRAVLIFLCHNDNISRVWIIINQGFFHRKSEEKKELMMKRYCKEDFIRIRDFLADTYAYFERPHN
ncbi:MAG: hypothetical protein Q8R87_03775, partial [Anaerolineaceae bacterium]|nr:hypothetical protein [Anaerolineaceae bacterium]